MKTSFSLIALGVVSTSLLSAQVFTPNLTANTAVESAAPDADEEKRSAEELDELFGPIALYPDALIALILPATTSPADVVMAGRYLAQKGDPAKLDQQPWDESVRGLARYPDVVKWMDENLAWTKQAGEAFLAQPADVMNSIQRLRNRARAAGTLVDTPQQRVVVDPTEIRIVPAEPDVIYVPRYDPEIVYVSRPIYYYDAYSSPFITFGIGYAGGWWLSNRIDWPRRTVCVIDRRHRDYDWRLCHEWTRPRFYRRPDYVVNVQVNTWRPPVVRTFSRPAVHAHYRAPVVRPQPIDGAPVRHVTWNRSVETNRVVTVSPQDRRPSAENPRVWSSSRPPAERGERGDNARPPTDRRTSVTTYRGTSVIATDSATPPVQPGVTGAQPQPRPRVDPNRFDTAGSVNSGGEVRRSTTTIVRRNGEIVTGGNPSDPAPAADNRSDRPSRRNGTTTVAGPDGSRTTTVVTTTTPPAVDSSRPGERRGNDRGRTVTVSTTNPPTMTAPATNTSAPVPLVAPPPVRTARGQAPDAGASGGSSSRVYARHQAPATPPAIVERPAPQPAPQVVAPPPPAPAPAVAPAPAAPANTETAANSRANPRNNQRGGGRNNND